MTEEKKAKCRIGDHDWKKSPRGTHEICTKCGDRFPCASACGHADCRVERGDPLDDYITLHVDGDRVNVASINDDNNKEES